MVSVSVFVLYNFLYRSISVSHFPLSTITGGVVVVVVPAVGIVDAVGAVGALAMIFILFMNRIEK